MSIDEGTILGGRYRLGPVVAETELGVLHRARHIQLDDAVMVNVLAEGVEDPRLAAKFVRTARNAARVKSEHVARFLDVGTLTDGRAFVVIEDLQGETLDRLLASRRTIDVVTAVDWTLEICDALAAAHAVGIVHRELRPSNVFIATAGGNRTVKVLGFGTARVANSTGVEEDAGLTVAGLRTGIADYSAPETFVRGTVDARADLWSVGALLFELLAGRRPFAGLPDEVIRMILAEPTPPIPTRPDLPEGLDAIVRRCLGKRPEERYDDVTALAAALTPFASIAGKAISTRIKTATSQPGLPVSLSHDGDETHVHASMHRWLPDGGIEKVTYDSLRAPAPAPPRSRRRIVDVALAIAAAVTVAAAIVSVRGFRARSDAAPAAAPVQSAVAATPSAASSEPRVEKQTAEAPSATPTATVTPVAATTNTPPPRAPRALVRPPTTVPIATRPRQQGTDEDPWGWKR